MLRAIHLENFRSFADSGRIELSDLNVFIGPNSAGKSNLMTVIELALTGPPRVSSPQPLILDQVPSFASFDSVVRRNGSVRARSPDEFSIVLDYSNDLLSSTWRQRYVFRKSSTSGAAFVHRAQYGPEGQSPVVSAEAMDPRGGEYRFPALTAPGPIEDWKVSFLKSGASAHRDEKLDGPRGARGAAVTTIFYGVEGVHGGEPIIVRPHRPVPRSIYVFDDPLMSTDDRRLIDDLLRLWSNEDGREARRRILDSLKTMTLAADIDVRTVARGQGTQLVEVRVKPRERGRAATLADVGYGVSQVLPLLLQDAQSADSNLLVYQPEVHLHPLAQSRLADVFVASVKRGNRAYIETHSEHLVLRLQALIAGGEIDPDRVRVFCVEHDGKKSNVHPMLFDERGIPQTPWPKGFLDTGLELARDLAQKRQSRPPAKKRDG
jgi:hypothetical protein